jgi:hypothetical protein
MIMNIQSEEMITDNEEKPLRMPVPDGHERLATQSECNDVNRRIERSHSIIANRSTQSLIKPVTFDGHLFVMEEETVMPADITALSKDGPGHSTLSDFSNSAIETRAPENQALESTGRMMEAPGRIRESGDQVNRFLLCALVGESAKRIKVRAGEMGESLPMTMIVRSVLRSYRLAAQNEDGPLARAEPDIAGLQDLNVKILKDEIARHSGERVRNSRVRLAHAERLRDDGRIMAERERLEQAIELRDRLADELR